MADQAGDEKRPTDPPGESENRGWVGDLAQRSSGVPPANPDGETKQSAGERSAGWRFAGIGFQFAGTVGLFAYFGYWVDQHFGWSPWGTVTLVLIAVIGNMYLLIKEALRQNR